MLPDSDVGDILFVDGTSSWPIDVESFDTNNSIGTMKKRLSTTMTKKETMHICHGVPLELPPGVSPYTSYPFLLHDRLTLPWSI
jgi:hypothetical protein